MKVLIHIGVTEPLLFSAIRLRFLMAIFQIISDFTVNAVMSLWTQVAQLISMYMRSVYMYISIAIEGE